MQNGIVNCTSNKFNCASNKIDAHSGSQIEADNVRRITLMVASMATFINDGSPGFSFELSDHKKNKSSNELKFIVSSHC